MILRCAQNDNRAPAAAWNKPSFLIFAAAGLTRPAPAESSQGRKAARVGG